MTNTAAEITKHKPRTLHTYSGPTDHLFWSLLTIPKGLSGAANTTQAGSRSLIHLECSSGPCAAIRE